eukprot:55576-Eustigmatos_ZCMA.PRE.1
MLQTLAKVFDTHLYSLLHGISKPAASDLVGPCLILADKDDESNICVYDIAHTCCKLSENTVLRDDGATGSLSCPKAGTA